MTDKPDDIVGHKTFSDGPLAYRHEPLTRAEADKLFADADAARAKRAADMPTEQDAINAMWSAYQRLRELGWNDATYCPKDGSHFDAVEPGSTGIFETWYEGEWPRGTWWCFDGGDVWPTRPTLYRVTNAEKARWASLRVLQVGEAAKRESSPPRTSPQPDLTQEPGGDSQ